MSIYKFIKQQRPPFFSEFKYKYAAKIITSTPTGLQRIVQHSRTYSDKDIDGVPDLITDLLTVNGRFSQLVNDALAAQETLTTAEGRSQVSWYDRDTLSITR